MKQSYDRPFVSLEIECLTIKSGADHHFLIKTLKCCNGAVLVVVAECFPSD